jgi:hypothetical protein
MPLPHFIPRHFPSLVIFCPLATMMIMGKVLVMRSLFNLATWMSRKLMLLPKDCNGFFLELPLQFESFWSGPLPMHLMRSWALLQVTLLSARLTILVVLDLDGTTGKTEEVGENHYIGEARYACPEAFIIPISFIRSSRSQRCKPRSIHYGHSRGGSFLISQSLEKAFLSGWLLLWNFCQWIYGAKSCSNNGRPRLWSFFIENNIQNCK